MDDLVYELHELFKDYALPNSKGIPQIVSIFSQYVPLPESVTQTRAIGLKNYDESDFEANLPCIVCRYESCTDYEERAIEMRNHNISLLFGVYSEEKSCQAWRDVMLMMDIVNAYFMQNRTLNDIFRVQMPVKMHLLDIDSWPVYTGRMDFIFSSGRVTQPAYFVHKRFRRED